MSIYRTIGPPVSYFSKNVVIIIRLMPFQTTCTVRCTCPLSSVISCVIFFKDIFFSFGLITEHSLNSLKSKTKYNIDYIWQTHFEAKSIFFSVKIVVFLLVVRYHLKIHKCFEPLRKLRWRLGSRLKPLTCNILYERWPGYI